MPKQENRPPFVVCLEGLIDKWETTRQGVVLHPVTKNIDYLVFGRSFVSFSLESKWEMLSWKDVVSTEEMNLECASLYRVLKNMECELKYEGLIKRKARFVPFSGLETLRRHVPEVTPNERLASSLNPNERLITLIMKVKPENMRVLITSMSQGPLGAHKGITIEDLVESYNHPSNITWAVIFNKILYQGPGYRATVRRIHDIFDMTLETCATLTSQIQDEIVQK